MKWGGTVEMLNERQQTWYDFGSRLSLEMVYNGAIIKAKPEITDIPWILAGYKGVKPKYSRMYRYGNLPDAGVSMNHFTHKWELGVSTISGRMKGDLTVIYENMGVELIRIKGWNLGEKGSEGETLLVDPERFE